VTQNAGEGPLTAAQDFADARFRINEKNRLIADAELSRRNVNAALVAAIMAETIAVIVLYLLRLPRSSPLQLSLGSLGLIDTAAVVVAVGVLGMGFRTLTRSRKTIGELRLELAQLREAERDARSRMPAGSSTRLLWTYHSDVLTTIDEYRNNARGYRRVHNRFQTVIIIGSLITTAISTAAVKYSSLEWAAVGVSFSVGVSAGMTGYFKFRERSMNLQQAADDLEQEYKAVELGIRPYRNLSSEEDRLVEFAERAEHIKDQQRKKEQQLEQPPETRAGTASTAAPAQG
jgi:Protein of unknown function (DUF4231)